MSMFLPEGDSPQQSHGVADVTPSNPETTQEDIALMKRVLAAASKNPNLIPSDFMAYMIDYIQTQRLIIPIGQVFGFSSFTVQSAPFIATAESTSSTSFTDLATVGPKLDGLPAGQYLILYGAAGLQGGSGAVEYKMSISVNGNSPSDNDSAIGRSADYQGTSIAVAKTLDQASNSIVCKYAALNAFSVTFARRWLLALKYSN